MDLGLPAHVGSYVRGRHSLVAPGLVQWKLGYIKKKMTESRFWSSSDEIRRSKILFKNAKKNGKNQLNTCNNEVLNLGCLELPVFGLDKNVLRTELRG